MQLMRDRLFTLIFILKLIQTAERPMNAHKSDTPQNTTNEFIKMIYKSEVEVAYNYCKYELDLMDIIKFLEYNELKGSDENLEKVSESSNHTKGFETDKNSSITFESIEEMRMEIIDVRREMDVTLKELNDYLDNAYDQTKVVFDLEDEKQKFLTFLEVNFEKLKNAFDEIVQNYYDRNTDYSELSLLDFDYKELCKNIEALICNLKKEINQTRTANNPNVLDTHLSQSADITGLLIWSINNTFAPEDEHIPDELIFRISDAAKKLHLMSEFLSAKFAYDQSFVRWTDMLKVWYTSNSLHIYIVTKLNELREGVSQHMSYRLYCADRLISEIEGHLGQEFIIELSTNLFPMVNLVKTMLKDTGFEKGFVDLIIACCNSSMNLLSMGTNEICIKASLEDRITFGDLLYAYWLFAVETNARLNEKKLIESELTLMMIDLKASMFKLYNAVYAINDVSEEICLDCCNLVNSLPYKVKNLFGIVHARLKIAKKENEEYEVLKMQILRILKEETLVLVDKEMAIVIQDAFESERFEVKNADGKILYHFKFINAYYFEKLDAAKKVLKKLLHHRNAKHTLIKVETIAFNSAWEHEKQTVHDNNDSIKKFRAKICATRTLVDIFEADKIDFINRSTNDKDKEIFSAIIDEKMQLLHLILKVYEEDINIIECKNLAKLMKVQCNKYSGDPKYAYDIFDYALQTRYRLDLACISINSYAVKTKLIKDIARIKMSHKDPVSDVSKLIYQLCVANGYTSDNLLMCDLQNMIQQRVAEMKCILDDFDSYCEEQAQCATDLAKKSKPHEKGPFGFLHKNLYILSRFASVYLKQKQLLDVSEEGKTSTEWKDKYVAWIESLHGVFENTLTNSESKIASIRSIISPHLQE